MSTPPDSIASDAQGLLTRNDPSQSLKQLAADNGIWFRGKKLMPDLFGRAKLCVVIESEGEESYVVTKVQTKRKTFSLSECEGVGRGNPHWLVHRGALRMIDEEVSWEFLKSAFLNGDQLLSRKEATNLIESCREMEVEVEGDLPRAPAVKDLPVLLLKDRTGAFADLAIDNGEQRITLQEAGSSAWESDLLETDFRRKQMVNSHYYCPLDKVRRSLLFLLECGWTIIDHEKRCVLPIKSGPLSLSIDHDAIVVKGSLKYEDYEASISGAIGAFNRREQFISLSGDSVGLLDDDNTQKELEALAEKTEIVGDTVRLPKRAFGSLESLFEADVSLEVDEEIKGMRAALYDFDGLEQALPSEQFLGELRDYQQQGVNWLHFLLKYGLGGILADEMGLGKTVQVIAFLSKLPRELPILIVAPRSLLFHWKQEFARFMPKADVKVHHGPKRTREIDAEVIVTSYGTLRRDLPLFQEQSFEVVVADEAQAIKNARSEAARALHSLNAQFRLSVTGTPIENHLGELWSQFRFVCRDLLGTEKDFQAKLQAGASDGRYLREIQAKVRPLILRRKKEEVAKELPEKTEQVVWVEMRPEQREVYEGFLQGYRRDLVKKVECDGMGQHRMEVLEAILRLRQICCSPLLVQKESSASGKLEALMEDLASIVSENRKVLVFSQFTQALNVIQEAIKAQGWPTLRLDGKTRNREEVVRQFQEEEIPIFLISLKAGGVGLNLTCADHVLLFDPWWNEAVEQQAIDRAHRIGRHDPVFAKRYVTRESIEEKMMRLKEMKRSVVDGILSQDLDQTGLTAEDLSFLLQ